MKKLLLLFLFILSKTTLSAQLFESFENTTGPEPLPSSVWTLGSSNWAVFNNGVGFTERWKINNTIATPVQVYQGENAAYISRENIGLGNTGEDYLVTPAIFIPANGALSFFSRTFTIGDQGTIYQIKIAPASAQQNDPNAYSLYHQFSESEINTTFDIYEEKIVDLSAYAGTMVYIAFVRKYTQLSNTLGGDRWLLDNVSVHENNNCLINNSCSQYFTLAAFLDSNNNGTKDNDESLFQQGDFIYQLNDSGTNQYATSNYGSYQIYNPDFTTSYDISYVVNNDFSPYFTCSTIYTDFTSNTAGNIVYFPVFQTNPYFDVGVNLYSYLNPRPGFSHRIAVTYRNYGFSVNTSGTLTFTKDPNLTISAISQSGIVTTPTGFTYDFTNLVPNESRLFYVDYLIPTLPSVSLGQLVTNTVEIQTANDNYLANNSHTYIQVITGSYDPNDKTESHGGRIIFADFGANDYLNYTIRFENTGTAAAEFIRIIDQLDSQLDESTFELIGASHNVDAIRNGTQLIFNFNQINLPPSSINSNDGHGYVQFKIKPKPGYAIGDIIPNTASIYFDFNPAIVTNTFNTEFVENLGVNSFENHNILLYPNPAVDFITITNTKGTIAAISIFDVSGKRIYDHAENQTAEININTSILAKGLYLLEITTEENHKTNKKLIIK